MVRLLAITLLALLLTACTGEEESFDITYPTYFPDPVYDFGNNPLTREGFELGRALFHDPILSSDTSISCASCHAQVHAFADHSTRLSKGVHGRLGLRNSPAIINVLWQPSFMWDSGINHIEVVSVAPITNPLEMDLSMREAIDRLNNDPKYRTWFNNVFQEEKVDDQQLLYALTQYMTKLISANSRYDQYRRGEYTFTASEERGYLFFKSHCATCHQEPLFTDHSSRNNGRTPFLAEEQGRYTVTLDSADLHKFKVPTLRNVELTYPYMHDGSLRQLDDVIEHYASGVEDHPNLDPSLKLEGRLGIAMSSQDKEDLIAFLKTLTDHQFISDLTLSE